MGTPASMNTVCQTMSDNGGLTESGAGFERGSKDWHKQQEQGDLAVISLSSRAIARVRLTAQNIIGVAMSVLYGLSRCGSLTRRISSPKTVKR